MARKLGDDRRLVKLTFADPADYDSRFHDEFEPVKCSVVGWLVKETRDCIRVAWLVDEIDGPSAGIAIPKGAVISVEKIRR